MRAGVTLAMAVGLGLAAPCRAGDAPAATTVTPATTSTTIAEKGAVVPRESSELRGMPAGVPGFGMPGPAPPSPPPTVLPAR